MNYQQLSGQILALAGGSGNVTAFTNCMTRLRLDLAAPQLADIDKIKALDGVMGVIAGDQLQIVVGPGHAQRLRDAFARESGLAPGAEVAANDEDADTGTYSALDELLAPASKSARTAAASSSPLADTGAADTAAAETAAAGEVRDVAAETRAKVKSHQHTGVHRLFRHIGNIFIPIIPAFIACGLVMATANIWKMINPAVVENSWFLAFAALGGIIGAALHLVTGLNTAKEFGGTPVLGVLAGAIPYLPQLAGLKGQPLTIPLMGSLQPALGGIIGVMITAWIFTVIEKNIRKVVPATLDLFLVPVLTLLCGALLCVFIIMPISAVFMKGINWVLIDFALVQGGVIGGYLLSATFLPLVMLGIHQGLTPIHAQLITDHGFTELLPVLAMAGAGQVGMAMAVWLKTHNKQLRKIINSALPIGFLGIGEPLIYGVSLPLFYPFITACLGAGFGGALVAFGMQVSGSFGATGMGVSGLLLTGLISNGQWLWYVGGLLAAYAGGFILTYLFGFKEHMTERLT